MKSTENLNTDIGYTLILGGSWETFLLKGGSRGPLNVGYYWSREYTGNFKTSREN